MEPLKSEWLSYSWPYCDKGKLIAGIFAKIREADFEAHIIFLLFCTSRKLLNSGSSRRRTTIAITAPRPIIMAEGLERFASSIHTKIVAKTKEILLNARDSPINVSAIY